MHIVAVESYPIETPVSFSNRTLTSRDHAITHVLEARESRTLASTFSRTARVTPGDTGGMN